MTSPPLTLTIPSPHNVPPSHSVPFLDASEIVFFPQGLVMSFYGVAGLTLALYLWLVIAWDVGAGFNEFNKSSGTARIFRFGFPGKDRRISLVTPLSDVRAVRVEVKEGLNPRRVLYVCLKGRQDIPLTRIGQPMALEEARNGGERRGSKRSATNKGGASPRALLTRRCLLRRSRQLEGRAAALARFLGVPIEGL